MFINASSSREFGVDGCYLSVPIIFRPSRRQTIKLLSNISTKEDRTACSKKASVTAMTGEDGGPMKVSYL